MSRSTREAPAAPAANAGGAPSRSAGSASSFYFSFLLLPALQRRSILELYAFLRAVDDAVDEEGTPSLEEWSAELDRVFGSSEPRTEVGAGLRRAVAAHAIPRAYLDALVRGCAMDRDERRYGTYAELADYSWHVAGAVGRACLPIFGVSQEVGGEYADRLGEALQFTNILRDVGEDARRGRTYLPREDLERFGVDPSDLRADEANAAVRELLAFEGRRAHELLERARRALPRGGAVRRRLIAPRIMCAVYQSLLNAMERSGYPSLTRRVRLPRLQRAWIAARVWIAARLSF